MNHITDQRYGDDRRSGARAAIDLAQTRVSWSVVGWIVGVIVTCLATYFAATSAFNSRVVVLETQQKNTEQRLAEMNTYLQSLNVKMDQILLNLAGDGRR